MMILFVKRKKYFVFFLLASVGVILMNKCLLANKSKSKSRDKFGYLYVVN